MKQEHTRSDIRPVRISDGNDPFAVDGVALRRRGHKFRQFMSNGMRNCLPRTPHYAVLPARLWNPGLSLQGFVLLNAGRNVEKLNATMSPNDESLHALLAKLFQAHPWHGVAPGADAPTVVNAYIEIVPTDAVKYELDKASGHLRVDRPQRFSSME